MEWFQVYVNDLSNRVLSAADDAAIGAWFRMLGNCYRLENGGCYEHCTEHSTRQWLSIAGVDREAVDKVVTAGLAAWEDDCLRVYGYDIAQQEKATERTKKGREMALARWSHAASNAVGNAASNAKERRGKEIKEEEKKENIRPAAEPAGPVGIGEDAPQLRLVEDPEAAKTKTRKPPKPDSMDNVLAVFKHYWHKHHHPMQRRPKPTSKTWRAIAARLRDGWTVEELCKSVDGFHLDPWHQGQNDEGKRHLELELCVRDDEHLEMGIEWAETPPKPGRTNRRLDGGPGPQPYEHPCGKCGGQHPILSPCSSARVESGPQ
jgi:hypothetical protein